MSISKWPKIFPGLTEEQQKISDDFMKYWHMELANKNRYGLIEKFNHGYVVAHAMPNFVRTLEIGAGLGEHLKYEKLSEEQTKNYTALELRQNMAEHIKKNYPHVRAVVGDCQKTLPYENDYFDRILGIHVLEHLPDLPSAIKELYRVCDKKRGRLSIVIPCEGGLGYSLARRISAQRLFEKRYKQPYKWFIEREHVNKPHEIFEELKPYFYIEHQQYFPLLLPSVNLNLCIGATLRPEAEL